MRHVKHKHILGVKKEHRIAMMAHLATALFKHGRIETTLAKAKALRPFAEKMITLAKKASVAEQPKDKLHYRRLAIAQIRDNGAVKQLFNDRVNEFSSRTGGYTRIFKILPRLGDAAPMALIELIHAADSGIKTAYKPEPNDQPELIASTDTSVEVKKPAAKKSVEKKQATEKKPVKSTDKKSAKPAVHKEATSRHTTPRPNRDS
ncbi:MAG: 50S ribosomal protein L17 [Verrucomicrobia bacterium GWF2_51_19]|nr:MAG: 50S ribosomal protein L17 [Verrucomicrobia bacterium GWF2_51_19]HCJ12597.1 50S ribosomal protein L17 [Opitutae bacterium]